MLLVLCSGSEAISHNSHVTTRLRPQRIGCQPATCGSVSPDLDSDCPWR